MRDLDVGDIHLRHSSRVTYGIVTLQALATRRMSVLAI